MNSKEITINFKGQSETYRISDMPCNYSQAQEFAAENGMQILPRWRLLEIDPVTGKERCRLIDEQISKGCWVWAGLKDTEMAWLVNLGTSDTSTINRSSSWCVYYALCDLRRI